MAFDLGFIVGLAAIAILLIIAGAILIGIFQKVLENAVIGIIALFIINYLGAYFKFALPINLITIALTAILGLAGVGLAIVLKLIGYL